MLKRVFYFFSATVVLYLAKHISISSMLGVSGYMHAALVCIPYVGIWSIPGLLLGTTSFFSIGLRLPGLVMSAMMYRPIVWTRLFFVGSICLFVLHPVGQIAWWYSLLWLVAFICTYYISWYSRLFTNMWLGHATGTIVWLYCGKLQPEMFIYLLPVVIVERCALSLLAVGLHRVYTLLRDVYKYGCKKGYACSILH